MRGLNRSSSSKELFLLLSSLSLVLLLVLLWFLFYLLEPRLSSLGVKATAGVGLAFTFAGVAALVLAGTEFISVTSGARLFPRSLSRLCAVHFLLPISERVGGILGISADRVKGAFLEFNNALVVAKACYAPPRRVLVLLPHCLQNSACQQMLDGDISNCADCGACSMSELKRLFVRYSVESRIVGGGQLALRTVEELKPDAVVGVACERELVAGIRETRNVPVIAISNWRPEGPCKNTKIMVDEVEDALWILLKHSN